MIRNLKILFAAAMALAAFGAIGASGAQAAEFHCSVEPCRFRLNPDGTVPSKTAHHVFIVESKNTEESVSFTCPQLSGEGTSTTSTASSLTVTNPKYEGECKANGSGNFEVRMNGCTYTFTAAGSVTVGCTGENVIEIELKETGCVFTIGPQGPLNGITYHNLPEGGKQEVTVSTNVHGIKVTADGGKPECLINPEQELEGTYTTGNTIVTAETDTEAPEMVNGWWE